MQKSSLPFSHVFLQMKVKDVFRHDLRFFCLVSLRKLSAIFKRNRDVLQGLDYLAEVIKLSPGCAVLVWCDTRAAEP